MGTEGALNDVKKGTIPPFLLCWQAIEILSELKKGNIPGLFAFFNSVEN